MRRIRAVLVVMPIALASLAGCRDVFGLEQPGHLDAHPLTRVDFATADSVKDEASGTFSVQVQLSQPSDEPVTVPIDVAPGGSATQGTDFMLGATQVTFAPGEVIQAVDVTIVKDFIGNEGDEEFQLVLGVPTGYAELGDTIVHTVTIRQPRVSFSPTQDDKAVAEGDGGSLTYGFNVVLDRPAVQRVTLELTATGTATIEDYDLVTRTLSIPIGSTQAGALVRVRGDTTVEPDETVVITLTAATNAILSPVAADLSRTITITNDD